MRLRPYDVFLYCIKQVNILQGSPDYSTLHV